MWETHNNWRNKHFHSESEFLLPKLESCVVINIQTFWLFPHFGRHPRGPNVAPLEEVGGLTLIPHFRAIYLNNGTHTQTWRSSWGSAFNWVHCNASLLKPDPSRLKAPSWTPSAIPLKPGMGSCVCDCTGVTRFNFGPNPGVEIDIIGDLLKQGNLSKLPQ